MKRLSFLLVMSCIATTNAQDIDPSKVRPRATTSVSQTLSDDAPIVIAHRGASGYVPEHTTESAAFAHALGADFIEQDVVLSKDGVAVVLHDVTLNAVSNVNKVFPDRSRDGKFYAFDFTLDELRTLRIHERYKDRSRFPQNSGRFQIATLEEHIQLIQGLNHSRKREAGLYVEIKKPALHHTHNLDVAKETLRVLAKYGYEESDDRVYVQCFEEDEVLRIRTELKCQLPLIQLWSKLPSQEQLSATAKVVDGIGVHSATVITGVKDGTPQMTDLVERAHRSALAVHVWTVRTDELPDHVESTQQFLDWLVKDAGVDGIFTDQPDAVLAWRFNETGQPRRSGPFHLLQGDVRQP